MRPLPGFGDFGTVDGGTVVVVAPGTVVVVVGAGVVVVVVSSTAVVVVVSMIAVVVVSITVVVVVAGVSSGVSTRFTIGVPEVLFLRTSRVLTSAGVREGFMDKTRAARPATWGEAIEVPEIVLVAELPEIQAEVICVPGAHMSTHEP